jgi:nitroreductase
MDVLDAIRKRRSVRVFKNKDVPNSIIQTLIDAARWAPSAGNTQPWEFIIVTKPDAKRELAEAGLGQGFIEEAPLVIVICADENRSSQRYGTRGKTLYCIQDIAASIQNIQLAACSLGLATCWVGAFKEDEAKKILEIPSEIRHVALIPVGYGAEIPEPRSRRPISQIVHNEVF